MRSTLLLGFALFVLSACTSNRESTAARGGGSPAENEEARGSRAGVGRRVENDAGYHRAYELLELAKQEFASGRDSRGRARLEQALLALGPDHRSNVTLQRATLVRDIASLAGDGGLEETAEALGERWAALMELNGEVHFGTPRQGYYEELREGAGNRQVDMVALAPMLVDRKLVTETAAEELIKRSLEASGRDPSKGAQASTDSPPDPGLRVPDPEDEANTQLGSSEALQSIAAVLATVDARIDRGELAAAEEALARELVRSQPELGSIHPRVLDVQRLRAQLLLAEGKLAEAKALLEQVLAELDGARLAGSWNGRELLRELAAIRKASGDPEGAAHLERGLHDLLCAQQGDDDPERLASAALLASTLAWLGRHEESLGLYRSWLRHPGSSAATQNSNWVDRWLVLGSDAQVAGDLDTAEWIYGFLLEDPAGRAACSDSQRVAAELGRARVLGGRGEIAKARAILERLLATDLRDSDVRDPSWRDAQEELANALIQQEDHDAALRHYVTLLSVSGGLSDHPWGRRMRESYGRYLLDRGDLEGALDQLQHSSAWPPTEFEEGLDLAEMGMRARRLQRDCQLREALVLWKEIVASLSRGNESEQGLALEAEREVAALLRVLGEYDQARLVERRIEESSEAGSDLETRLRRALARLEERGAFPTELWAECTTPTRDGEFEYRATIHDGWGIRSVRVEQDGVPLHGVGEPHGWVADQSGRRGSLRLALSLPPGRMSSVIKLRAETFRGESVEDTVVATAARPR